MTEISETIFIHPFTCLIAGPTSSGKTTIIEKILDQNVDLIKPEINRIIYCYSKWQGGYDILKEKIKSIEFFEGIYDIDSIDHNANNLLILDDLTHLCEKDESILNLFITDSHHKNISVFLLINRILSRLK